MIDVSGWYFKSSPQRHKEHKEKNQRKSRGLSLFSGLCACVVNSLIRESLIHRQRSQIHQELSETLHENIHQSSALIGGGRARVAQAGVRRHQVPGTSHADPAAIDSLKLGGLSRAGIC